MQVDAGRNRLFHEPKALRCSLALLASARCDFTSSDKRVRSSALESSILEQATPKSSCWDLKPRSRKIELPRSALKKSPRRKKLQNAASKCYVWSGVEWKVTRTKSGQKKRYHLRPEGLRIKPQKKNKTQKHVLQQKHKPTSTIRRCCSRRVCRPRTRIYKRQA